MTSLNNAPVHEPPLERFHFAVGSLAAQRSQWVNSLQGVSYWPMCDRRGVNLFLLLVTNAHEDVQGSFPER
jgi:hypothetical protein